VSTVESVYHQYGYPEPDRPPSPYTLVNAAYWFPVIRGESPEYDPGTIIMRIDHPMSYGPYLYEGFGPHERATLKRNDLSMYLIHSR
jgi:hypothetical protein